MISAVLDASALLAFLRRESGGERVDAVLDDAVISAINLAEVATHYAKLGAGEGDIRALFSELTLRIVPVDLELAMAAAMLRPKTLAQGLSLANRVCLALAGREGVAAFTADRIWSDVVKATGVRVEVIR